nr:DoxX family protein [Kofleriaceae bacterium]
MTEAHRASLEGYLWGVLRIAIGVLFACHGAQKLLGWFPNGHEAELPMQLKVGGVIELVGGLLFAVGLVTRGAAFVMAGQMAVAYFQFHVAKSWHGIDSILPITNNGDDTVLYCFVFLYAIVRGPGPLSLDRKLGLNLVWAS